jgi:hypothetical protein
MNPVSRTLQNLLSILAFVVLGAALYLYTHPVLIPAQILHLVHAAPCDQPIVYTLGSVDSHFGLSADEYAADIQTAAAIWNVAAGKQVLSFSTTTVPGSMPVSLVFDEREATLLLGKNIDNEQSMSDAERTEIHALEAQISLLQTSYSKAQDSFNSQVAAYQTEVHYWNSQGGADPATRTKLENERMSLEATQTDLNAQAAHINSLNDNLKAKVASFNTQIQKTNQQVQAFDAQAGDFEQGLYQKDATGAKITIYAFKDKSELIRTLEHEFGHSLGLDHNTNSKSIMYAYIENLTSGPSTDDLAALKKQCDL